MPGKTLLGRAVTVVLNSTCSITVPAKVSIIKFRRLTSSLPWLINVTAFVATVLRGLALQVKPAHGLDNFPFLISFSIQ